MNDTAKLGSSINQPAAELGDWDRFWFRPASPQTIALIRTLLCLITIGYFASSWTDVDAWYGSGAVLSTDQTTTFLIAAGLQPESRWIISPLFLTDNPLVYRGYLLTGIGVAVVVLLGRGGRFPGCVLWLLVVGWANRAMILSSLAETLLSLSWFALAMAPATSPASWFTYSERPPRDAGFHWTNRFARRLLAIQITIVGLATFVSMLSGRVWWNGLGAYALAAPVEDRTIDWSQSFLAIPLGHDLLTFALVAALPLGFGMGWLSKRKLPAITTLTVWSVVVALLSSHWIYAATFATMSLSFLDDGSDEISD